MAAMEKSRREAHGIDCGYQVFDLQGDQRLSISKERRLTGAFFTTMKYRSPVPHSRARALECPPHDGATGWQMVVTSSGFSPTALTPRSNSSELRTNPPATGHIEWLGTLSTDGVPAECDTTPEMIAAS
jgi:hypothetical protein